MRDENESDTVEASGRPKKKKLTEILAGMSPVEATAYLENFPVHATETLSGEWRDRFSQTEEENALAAARDARFKAEVAGDMAARFNWK